MRSLKEGDVVRVLKRLNITPNWCKQWCKVAETKVGKPYLVGGLAIFKLNDDPNTSDKYWFVSTDMIEWQDEVEPKKTKIEQLSIFDI